ELLQDRKALILALCVVLSCLSNAWLFTFTTFLAVVLSSFVFRYYTVEPELRLLIQAVVYCTNWFAFIVQMFQIDDWFQYNKSKQKNTFRSEEHTSELQSRENLVCRLLLEK